ncbi:unnamed protein product [Closterium sp. NIES-54]
MRSGLRLLLVGGAATARARGARVVEGMAGASAEAVEEAEGVAVEVGVVSGVGDSVAVVEVVEAAAEVVEAAAAVVEAAAAVAEVAVAVVLVEVQLRSVEALVVASASSSRVPVRPRRPSSFVSGTLRVGGVGVLFPDAVELPRWDDLLRQNMAIFDLDFDAILAAMYALTDSAEGDCYLSVPPDPGIEAAALGASASAAPGTGESAAPGAGEFALSGTAPTEALHTFTLDSGASRSFFRDSTTLTPLSWPVAVSLADLSGGPVLAHSSTVLPCPAAPSGLLSGLHLPSFSTNLGRQRAAPHSSTFPPTEAPLQTLHMDVWGPARVRGQGHECYFLLVVDDYSRYTTVFPLRSKGEVPEGIRQTFTFPASPQQNGIAERRIGMVMDVARTSMIHAAAPHFLWLFAIQYAAHQNNLQPRVSLPETTPTLRWTGKVGDASAFNVWGSRAFVRDNSADKLSSRAVPSVFLGSPPAALGWQFDHPISRRVLSSQDVTFDETGPAPSGVSQVDPTEPVEVAVDSGAARGAEPERVTNPLPPQGPAPSGVSQVDPTEPVEVAVNSGAARGTEPERLEPGGAEPGGTASGGAEPTRAESRGSPGVPLRREPLSPQRLREWHARHCRRATGAAGGAAGAGATRGAAGAGAVGGAAGVGAAGGAAGAGAAGGAAGAGAAGGAAGGGAAGAAGPGGACTGGAGAAGAGGAAGVGAAGIGAGGATGVVTGDPGAEGTGAVSAVSGGAARPRPYYPSSPLPGPSPYSGPTRGLTERREPESCHVSPVSCSASPVRTARTGRRTPRPPPVPSTHSMILRPSTAPQCVPLPSPPASSLPDGPDPVSYSLRAASPTVTRFLATAVTDPLFESTTASALIAELVDFAAACHLDYATSLVAESASASVCPPSVGGECALGTDVLEDRHEEFEFFAAAVPHLVSMLLAPEGDPDAPDIPTPHTYAEAIEGPYSSQWQAAMDAKKASWKSTGTYVDEVPPPGANIVSGMWIFRVKRPPGSLPVFKAHYVAHGFSQRQGVDFFQTFSPTPKMTTLRVLLHVAAQRNYELHSLDFSTAFLQGSLHEEIWLRRPPGFTRSFPPGTQWSLRRPVHGLCQAPPEWRDTLRTTLAALGFAPSTADPSLFLRTDTTLPPFYVPVYIDDLGFATADTEALAHMKSELQKRDTCTDLGELTSYLGLRITRVLQRFGFTYSSPLSTPLPTGHSLSAPPSDESVEPSGPTSGMGLVLGGRARAVLTGHADASWVDDLATQRPSQGYTFSLGSGSVSWRSTRSSSVLSSICEAAQELCWLTYLLTDLGEAPRSPPVLYVDNKAMLALCQEHRLEHRTKHIALRYFLARELQQRGQLRLAYVASQGNTADVFTKALQPCDHQHFCTVLGLVPTVPHDKIRRKKED